MAVEFLTKEKWVTDPDTSKSYYCITEVADAKQYTALKAFAELNELAHKP